MDNSDRQDGSTIDKLIPVFNKILDTHLDAIRQEFEEVDLQIDALKIQLKGERIERQLEVKRLEITIDHLVSRLYMEIAKNNDGHR